MNLYAPSVPVFAASVAIAAAALAGKWFSIPWFSDNAFWIAVAAFVVLALGNVQRTV